MKCKFLLFLGVFLAGFLSGIIPTFGQGTSLTYQGRLATSGNPANGAFDFTFAVFDSASAGSQVGSSITNVATTVSNGLFTVTLDFGANVFTGPARWLAIGVKTNGAAGGFLALTPRQSVTAAPYSIRALTASDVTAGAVVKSLNTLHDDLILQAGTNVTLTTAGNTLTLSAAGAGGSGIWAVNGNNAYYTAGNVGIGTNNPQSKLVVRTPTGSYGMIHTDGTTSVGSYVGSSASGASGGWLGTVSANPLHLYVNGGQPSLTVNTNGSVGIGTTTPVSKLELAGQDALRITGYQPFLTMLDTNASSARGRIQAAAGDVNLFTESYLNGSNTFSFLKLANSGNVGIGSSAPVGKLEVVAQDALRLVGFGPFLTILDSGSGYARSRIQGVGGDLDLFTESYLSGANPYSFLKVANNGNVSIGSASPVGKLEVVAQDALRLVGYQPFLTMLDNNAGYARSRIQGVGGAIVFEPESVVSGSNPNASVTIATSGNVSMKSLTIRGGADLAEPFEFSGKNVPKGYVVCIDPENPGKLRMSSQAYDKRVAGVVSGANGINPGISISQEGINDAGQNVALSGRVYVQTDAQFGEIEPGDLLTTSATPGHAMKVSNPLKAQGAILGKAMSGLKHGKGMVLVLVTLQ